MHLRRIELRDFKAYEHAFFEFPPPEGGRNVILIGGLNGFGKTSLFEAIALGLYGRDALSLINRARPGIDDEERRVSFRNFMRGVLHAAALAAGRRSVSITLDFEDRYGQPLRINRRWHYLDSGDLQPDSDELRILEGVARRPMGPPDDEPYPESWYREWIFRHFLPTNQASFFLFDGEAAAVFAERDMTTQIKDCIEGLLGLIWLKRLADALKTYADDRRRQIPRDSSDEIVRLEGEIASAEEELHKKEQRLEFINRALSEAETARDRLVKELSGYGPATQAQLQELIEEQKRQEKAYEEAGRDLNRLEENDLPLALVGQLLSRKTEERLEQEFRLERWVSGREETRLRLESVWSEIERGLGEVVPPLDDAQRARIKIAIESGLDRLWNPPPPGMPDHMRHPHATGGTRSQIRLRLQQARSVHVEKITGLVKKSNEASGKIKELDRLIESVKMAGPELEAKRRELRDLNVRIAGLNRERGEIDNLLRSKGAELDQKRRELARMTERIAGSAPFLRRAARADQIREMLKVLAEEAWPLQAEAIAQEMTRAVQNMAHRSDYFHKVEISPSGELRLLSRDGRNMRELDLSAGEKQIFTQALFAAVAKVSGRTFPLVIDTPLGRLDEEHRLNVLRHLADREGQVILISTNTEVVGPYLEAIRPKIAKAYRLESVTRGDIRVTFPVPGYFPGTGLDGEVEGLGP
jgi:DNA sulfur modification protein DndD